MIILILDEASTSTVYKPVTYSDFISPQENIQLILITSIGGASEKDKKECLQVIEIPTPTRNAEMEQICYDLHSAFGFDIIYTKQEDLIMRAAYLRQSLGIHGLQPKDAILFRDKFKMKDFLESKGVPVGPFRHVRSPCDLLDFSREYEFPLIIKPTLGSASQGIHLIKDYSELELFLQKTFFKSLGDDAMEYQGDWMVETFIDAKMFHVNGYYSKELKYVWPFEYVNTNFDFTSGKYYGNALVQKNNPLYSHLISATNKILEALPCPDHLIFHLELFYHNNEFLVCEIAARRAGGSIGLLIDSLIVPSFPMVEFRLNNGLDIDVAAKPNVHCVGDIMVPLKMGILKIQPTNCPFGNIIPICKPGHKYLGFNLNSINTSARIVCEANDTASLKSKLQSSLEWYSLRVEYEPIKANMFEKSV